jgi:hypothetical protein
MTAKTYHTSLEDARLDGWYDACELPINGGEIHSHGLRCYVKSPRRVLFLKLGLSRGRMTTNELAGPLGMKLPFQVHQFLHHLKFQLTVEKSPIRVNIVKEGRLAFWEVIDKRRQNEKTTTAN